VRPLLLRAAEACQLCAISPASWERLDAAGKIPSGLWLGGAKVWRYRELLDWVAVGMPARKEWEALRAARDSNGKR